MLSSEEFAVVTMCTASVMAKKFWTLFKASKGIEAYSDDENEITIAAPEEILKNIVNVHTCQRWFSKFRSEELILQESDRSERPSKIDNDVLRFMLKNNPHCTSQEIAEEFGIHHTTVGGHIKSLGFVLKRSFWVPHDLTEKNLSDLISAKLSNGKKSKSFESVSKAVADYFDSKEEDFYKIGINMLLKDGNKL
ncbi:histone-lysine N-methyltransferase SETMAR [Trichonephila clavipes]|nr:histone-lysine N-methyltransferase SETMAR [Trichonephila clavipes]